MDSNNSYEGPCVLVLTGSVESSPGVIREKRSLSFDQGAVRALACLEKARDETKIDFEETCFSVSADNVCLLKDALLKSGFEDPESWDSDLVFCAVGTQINLHQEGGPSFYLYLSFANAEETRSLLASVAAREQIRISHRISLVNVANIREVDPLYRFLESFC